MTRLGTCRLRHPKLRTVAFAPDGKHLATSNGRTVCLWQRAQGRLLWQRPVEPPVDNSSALVFSPDGKLLAVGSVRGVQVWRTATGDPVRNLGKTAIKELAFDATGRRLIGAQADRGTLECIRHWDLASGRETACVKIEPRGMWTLSPDGQLVVFWGGMSQGFYDTRSGVRVRPLHGKIFQPGLKLRFTPNGKLLYCLRSTTKNPGERGRPDDGRPKDTIQCWEVASGRALRPVGGRYERWHSGVAVSPDGQLVAYGGQSDEEEHTLELRDRASGARRHLMYRGKSWSHLDLNFDDVLFAPDGRVVAGWDRGIVFLWDVASGKPLWVDEENYQPVVRMRFTPDGHSLLTQADYEYAVRQWDAATGKEVHQFRLNREELLRAFALSLDGRTLALGCNLEGHKGDEVRLIDMASAREIRRFPMPYDLTPESPGGAKTHRFYWGIDDLAFRDNRTLCVGFGYGRVTIWDVTHGKLTRCEQESTGRFEGLSADGRIFFWQEKGLVNWHVRDLKTRRECTFPAAKYSIRQAWFSSEHWLLLGFHREKLLLELMDLRTGQLRPLHGRPRKVENPLIHIETAPLGPAALSADGQSLAYVDEAGDLIRLFDVRSGRMRGCFHSDQGAVRALLFSPDGKRLASAGQNCTVLIWDVASAQPLPEIRRSEREIEALWQKLVEKKTADAEEKTEAADAMWQLTESPRQVLPWLRRHLRPAPAPDTSRLSLLLRQLDSDDFQTRQRAYKEIQGLGEAAEDALKQTLAGKPSLEVRRRVQELLRRLAAHRPTHQRELRAVEALEHIGSREARTLLKKLAGGRADAALTRAARAAQQRMDKESTSPGAK